MEGQFSRRYKGPGHPHTNMAKAALNMLTRTSAGEMLTTDGILMTAVDTGWITDERPHFTKVRLAEEGFKAPLDLVDGAARVYDPIVRGEAGEDVHGCSSRTTRPALVRVSMLDPDLSATHADFIAARPAGADEDVHMLPGIVDHVIETLTLPGAVVLDPFAGFGTTLARAAALGRRALGVELLPERVEHVRQLVPAARVVEGDARELLRLVGGLTAGPVDLILTSPPYMTVNDHAADPLTAYELEGGDYGRYLAELGLVAAQCARLVAPAASWCGTWPTSTTWVSGRR
ncbi:DNA methyltransferase [Tessaracoccus coleopterorum]|uniref:DNA methyltransferase n=1 Tax=Tessaracoccus coleopterorum TaxID=2714950 RepID=UPI001E522792|nr:DNA methyltransferase [Tessaracoccus coleopterorum]